MATESFPFPPFHSYPPYFTLQPIDATREKQCALWSSLILNYCRHYKIYALHVGGDAHSNLFGNPAIRRKLSPEGKRVFFEWMVRRGNGMWKESGNDEMIVLWKSIAQWADTMLEWVTSYGMENSVLTLDEISSGDESSGTELEGLDRDIIVKAVEHLQSSNLAQMFQGDTGDDLGIKFFKRRV